MINKLIKFVSNFELLEIKFNSYVIEAEGNKYVQRCIKLNRFKARCFGKSGFII